MTRYTQKSFTGGELSPALYSRNDLAKYVVGLKTLKNGFVRAEGCVSNRAGLELICEVKNSASKTRLIPFSFNTEQTYIIEMVINMQDLSRMLDKLYMMKVKILELLLKFLQFIMRMNYLI